MHHAVMTEEKKDGCDSDVVIEEFQKKGYKLGEKKVVRPSMVKVSS